MKKLSELDKNLAVASTLEEKDLVFFNAADAPFEVYGAANVREYGYLRMPPQAAAAVSDGVAQLMPCTSGIRVRFSTDSPHIAIRCTFEATGRMSFMPLLGSAGFDLFEDTPDGKKCVFKRAFLQPEDMGDGYESILYVGAGPVRCYTIHFPLYTRVASLHIGLSRSAAPGNGAPYRVVRPLVFYGSSITMGGCASRPGNSYPAFISRMLGADFVNLGFAGNAKGEPAMADYLAAMDMSALVIDYDHNAHTVEHLETSYQPFFRRIREERPTLPIILVTRPDFEADPPDSVLRRDIIHAVYKEAISAGDQRVFYIDGETLFGAICRTDCTVDGVHPNDLGFYRMASTIRPVLAQALAVS